MTYLHLVTTPLLIFILWFFGYKVVILTTKVSNKLLSLGLSWYLVYAFLVLFCMTPFGIKIFSQQLELFRTSIVLIAVVIFIRQIRNFYLHKPHMPIGAKKAFALAVGFLIFYIIILLLNIVNINNRLESVFSSMGTLHTGKYVYLSEYMTQCQNIPSIRNNLGQSSLAFIITDLSGGTNTYSLTWILASSMASLMFFAWGLIEIILEKPLVLAQKLISGSVFLFGNYALSLAYVLVNDSGSPIFLVGYSDTLFGIFALLLFGYMSSTSTSISSKSLVIISLLVISGLYWTSPQSLLLVGVCLIHLALRRDWTRGLRIFLGFILSLFAWRGQSGILGFASGPAMEIPGIISPNVSNPLQAGGELFSPGIPFLVGSFVDVPYEISPRAMDSAKDLIESLKIPDYSRAIWHLEQFSLSTIRPVFWPLLAYGMILLLHRNIAAFDKSTSAIRALRSSSIFIVSFTYLIMSFTVTLFFKFNQMKWEMTRFPFSALAVGMLLLSILILILFSIPNKRKLTLFIMSFLIFPTVLHSTSLLYRNIDNINLGYLQVEIGKIGFLEETIHVNC